MLLAGDAQPRLRDEVAKRERREQSSAFAQKMGASLLDHDFERRVIRRQMMRQDQQQPSIRRGIVSEESAHHRSLTDVEAKAAWIEASSQLLGDIAVGGVERDLLDDQRRVAPDHLHGLGQAFPDDGRAQYVLPGDDRLQCVEKSVDSRARVEGEQVGRR